MNIGRMLESTARTFPDRPAVFEGAALHLDYAGLHRAALGLARELTARHGVAPGDRVLIASQNQRDYFCAMWATWHAGACLVPVNYKLHGKEMAFIIGHCAPRVVFASEETAQTVATALTQADSHVPLMVLGSAEFIAATRRDPVAIVERALSDPSWIFYTSGTTGRPKGATLTNANLIGMTTRYYADVDFVTEEDTMLHLAPLSHGSGLYSLPLIAKGGAQIVPQSGGFDEDEALDLAGIHRRITTFLAPTMVNRIVRHPRAATVAQGHWQTIFYGGAPMYVEDIKRALATFGPVFWQGYGQGETPCTITSLSKRQHVDTGHPEHEARLGSAGIARCGVEVRVVDDNGKELPSGERGEIIVRSDVTMAGYWNDEAATARAIRDGWLYTGDIGAFSADGFLTLLDRSKDMIISGGSNIYPREIEEVLLRDARVLEVSVIGAPDREWGEVPVAFVVLQQGASVDVQELDHLCLENISRFKRPKHYHFVASLPKSSYGKILKTALRAELAAGAHAEQSTPAGERSR